MKRVEHCRLETHPQFFDFFVEGCQFKPVESLTRAGGRMIELVDTFPDINVQPAEYKRLLGYPRDTCPERPRARAGRLARARGTRRTAGRGSTRGRRKRVEHHQRLDPHRRRRRSPASRLQNTLQQADADSVILVAVSAGPEVEDEAQRLWQEEKPDEYFFLEIYGSAVVEHLVTMTGARLCAWADGHGMAVLPHYSPGYPEWDIAEQPRLLELIRRTRDAVAAGEHRSAGIRHAPAEEVAARGVRPDAARRSRAAADRARAVRELFARRCQYRRVPYDARRSVRKSKSPPAPTTISRRSTE